MATTVIEAVQKYIKTYSGLATNAPVWVAHLGQNPTEYSIVPLPGARVVETYLNNGTLREFPFALQSVESTGDELERFQKIGFYEMFAAWLDTQTLSGALPIMDTGQTPESIEALGWGYLMDQGPSGTGIYQVQCKLTYEQAP